MRFDFTLTRIVLIPQGCLICMNALELLTIGRPQISDMLLPGRLTSLLIGTDLSCKTLRV